MKIREADFDAFFGNPIPGEGFTLEEIVREYCADNVQTDDGALAGGVRGSYQSSIPPESSLSSMLPLLNPTKTTLSRSNVIGRLNDSLLINQEISGQRCMYCHLADNYLIHFSLCLNKAEFLVSFHCVEYTFLISGPQRKSSVSLKSNIQ